MQPEWFRSGIRDPCPERLGVWRCLPSGLFSSAHPRPHQRRLRCRRLMRDLAPRAPAPSQNPYGSEACRKHRFARWRIAAARCLRTGFGLAGAVLPAWIRQGSWFFLQILQGANHVVVSFVIVKLALIQDGFATVQGVLDRHAPAAVAGQRADGEKRLCEKTLKPPRPRHGGPVGG